MMDGNKSEIGLPRVADPGAVIDYLGEMCAPYGVSLSVSDDGKYIDCKW
jgi:hypothetical protein